MSDQKNINAHHLTILMVGHLLLVTVLFGCKKSETVEPDSQSAAHQANPFKSVEYFPAPNQIRMKTQLSGSDAQPLDGGLLAIKELKLELFSTNGQPQVVATAPDCIYDSANREARSPGKLYLQNGDGKIRAEGEGFLWRQNESSLTISNDVKTFIASMALAAGLSAGAQTNLSSATNETAISARVANFELNSREAIYSGDVQVMNPQMKLRCEWLVADLPQSGHINHIVAETNVMIDLMQTNETAHATGDKAEYTYSVENGVTNEMVVLTGNPVLKDARGTSTGEKIIWYPADNHLQIINPRGSAIISAFNRAAQTNLPANTNQLSPPK